MHFIKLRMFSPIPTFLKAYILKESLYPKGKLNFIATFFSIYWNDHIFPLCSVIIMNKINWFSNVKPSCISRMSILGHYAISSYNAGFNLWILCLGFCIYVHRSYWHVILISCNTILCVFFELSCLVFFEILDYLDF